MLKCVSIVGAYFQHGAIEAHTWIDIRRFKVEIVPECQRMGTGFEKREHQRIESFVTYCSWIVDERGIGRCVLGRSRYSIVGGDPEGEAARARLSLTSLAAMLAA